MPVVAPSEQLSQFIRDLGLDPSLTRRIVIDIPLHGVAKVYVELLMSERAIEVNVPAFLAGAEIEVVP